MIENGLVTGYTSPQLIQEFEKVMNYPKFRLSEEEITSVYCRGNRRVQL
ncbi:MAG: hypothetical protein QXR97_00465 [Thermoproteota archaeon]